MSMFSQVATATNVSSAGSGVAWVSSVSGFVSDLATSDDVRVSAALGTTSSTNFSQSLSCTGFGLSIPARAAVTGVVASLERSRSGSGFARDLLIRLLVNGSESGDNKADTATRWPGADEYRDYGAANDTWGNELTPDIVNASNFGIRIRAKNSSTTNSETAMIDHLTLTVWYALPALVTERFLRSGQTVRATYSVRCDGNGDAAIDFERFVGKSLCAIRVTPQSATNLFDVTLDSMQGDDLLAGEMLDLSASDDTTIRPFIASADADESQPLIVPHGSILNIRNAGEDASLVVEVMARDL